MLDHSSFLSHTLAQMRPSDTGPALPAPSTPPPAVSTQSPAASQPSETASGTATTGPNDVKKDAPLGSNYGFFLVIGALILLFWFMSRGQKKTENARKQMLANMKKGDEVMTIGGMVARIVSIDDDEVVLKIDESANVKARYKKSAIQQVLTAEDKAK